MIGLLNRTLCLAAFLAPGGYSLRPAFQRWRGVRMGRNIWLSHLVYMDALYPEAITIGDNVTIGLRTTIFTHFHRGPARAHGYRAVTIEDDAFIGPQCVILPGVHIGHGAVIKAGSVLSRNVPPLTFWGTDEGRPLGRVTVPLTPDHDYSEFIQGLRLFRSRGTAGRSLECEDNHENFCARFDI